MPPILCEILSALVIFVAGFIRGYSGFGSGMFAVLGLSLLFPPSEMVPPVLILEVVASSYLLPGVWRVVDWSSIGWLFLGAAIGTPVGARMLAIVPANSMRAAIAVIVMALVLLFRKGVRFHRVFNKPGIVGTGVVSGVLNGGAAIGGPPVILFFFSSNLEVAISRASLIAYFFGTDLYAASMCAVQGLIGWGTLRLTAVLLPPLMIGLALGKRSFIRTDPDVFRLRVFQILMLLSVGALVRAVLA